MLITIGWLMAGLVLLVAGAELLVRGASRLAALAGISPLVIGLTVVAYGTSAPELVVSVQAGLQGNSEIAVANVVGSNIFNVLFILGLCALILPLRVATQLVRIDVPIAIAISVYLWLLARKGYLGPLDGLILLALMVGYNAWSIWTSRRDRLLLEAASSEPTREIRPGAVAVLLQFVLIGAGLALLVLGARWLVTSAVAIAAALGVSQEVIGLTIVAAGTSLPEVATSVVAALRGQRDIAIGNVVGSNIFNILLILGVASLVTPGGLAVSPAMVWFDIPVMIAAIVVCLPVFFTGLEIARWEGAVLLFFQGAYTTYLILREREYDVLHVFNEVMLLFVLPLLVLALGTSLLGHLRKSPQSRETRA